MNKDSNYYSYFFITILCFTCGMFLSLVSIGLRNQKNINVEYDKKKNILKVMNVDFGKMSKKDFLVFYDQNVEKIFFDQPQSKLPVYCYKQKTYAFPIEGPGLWSKIYGYVAIANDGVTIEGITFYNHGETPGLGGQIEDKWFTQNFKEKKIWDPKTNQFRTPVVFKGKISDNIDYYQKMFFVDGITGATKTSDAVSAILKNWLIQYEPFLVQLKDNNTK